MALTINGTDGIATNTDTGKIKIGASDDIQIFNDGSVNRFLLDGETYFNNKANSECFIITKTNGAVELYHDGSKKLETTSGGVASSGQIDINNSTANAVGDLDDPADYGLVLRGSSTSGEGTGIAFTNDDKSAVGSAICHIDNGSNNIGHLAFYTSASSNTPVEKMRIRSDGNILIGMQDFSSTPSASNYGIALHNTNNASVWAAGGSTTSNHIIWANTNGTCGSIQTEGTGTSYNTSSDYRLKENIVTISHPL